jgi:hypothetical protein
MEYKRPHVSPLTSAFFAILLLPASALAQSAGDAGWPNYGNDPGGARYSAARQIDRTNVTELRLARLSFQATWVA